MATRILPYSPDAERAVIGACLLDDKALTKAVSMLGPDDFYDAENKEIFRVIQTLALEKKGVDSVVINNYMEEALDQTKHAELIDAVGFTYNISTYIEILIDKSTRRKLMYAAQSIYAMCEDDNTKISAIVDAARNKVLAAGMGERIAVTDPTIFRAAREERLRTWGQLPLAGFGIPLIDGAIGGGLLPGETMILIGADGSMKTSMALKMADSYLSNVGWPVLYVSLDMPADMVDLRRLLPILDMNETDATKEQLTNSATYQWAVAQRDAIDGGRFKILEGERSLADIRRAIELESPKLVILDYLTAIDDGKSELEKARMASRAMVQWAKEYQITIVALNQMSQESKVNQRKGTTVGVGAGLGGQDPNRRATVVIELLKDISSEALPDVEAKLIAYICKNRKGPEPLAFKVYFEGKTMSILSKAVKVRFRHQPKPIFSDGGSVWE